MDSVRKRRWKSDLIIGMHNSLVSKNNIYVHMSRVPNEADGIRQENWLLYCNNQRPTDEHHACILIRWNPHTGLILFPRSISGSKWLLKRPEYWCIGYTDRRVSDTRCLLSRNRLELRLLVCRSYPTELFLRGVRIHTPDQCGRPWKSLPQFSGILRVWSLCKCGVDGTNDALAANAESTSLPSSEKSKLSDIMLSRI